MILILIVLLALGGWWLASGEKAVEQVVAVRRGDLLQTVSLSGRVTPSSAVDLAFETTGRVKRLPVEVGQTVSADEVLVELENSDAERAVKTARLALADAELALERLLSPIARGVEEEKLAKAYEDGLADANEIYNDLYTILDGLKDVLFEDDFKTGEDNIEYYAKVVDMYNPSLAALPKTLARDYRALEEKYQPAFEAYRTVARGGDAAAQERAIFAAAELTRNALNIIKSSLNLLQFFRDRSLADSWTSTREDLVSSHLVTLTGYFDTINEHWLTLTDSTNTIRSQQSTVTVDDLDVRAQKLEIARQETLLAEAEKTLADTYLRAPFAGVVTAVAVEAGEVAAANSPVVSLISSGALEVESFAPEINIAALALGDRAEITLDAYGERVVFPAAVSALDPAETVRDGVSTYKVTLRFLVADERIRSGMTANIVVKTDERADVLLVPAGAVVYRAGYAFVRTPAGAEVEERPITIGAESSFGEVEILSGLEAGELVLVPNGT